MERMIWLLCPVCGNKTRLKVRQDTELINFPLYCPKCKQETLVNVKNTQLKDKCYPLVEWGMTEKDCLAYCYAKGFDWGGLYDVFRRVSCWCCPLQPLSGLRKLYTLFPELWQKLRAMDDHTWRQFRADYSVRQLELRFQFEQQCQQAGISLTSREFFRLLKEHLQKQEGVGASSTV